MTLTTAITAIAASVASVSGIARAPSNPMENINEYPFALIYLLEGVVNDGPIATRKSLTSIAIDLLTVRRDVNLDMAILTPFLDTVPTALLTEMSYNGDRFSNTIETFEQIRIEFMPLYPYAGVDMIGYRFIMENVKILINL